MQISFDPTQFPVEDAQILIRLALAEDVGSGDVTSKWTIPPTQQQTATLIAKEAGIIAGMAIPALVFAELGVQVNIQAFVQDGDRVSKGDTIMTMQGATQSLLVGERTLLNFMQQLSGVASITNSYAQALQGGKIKVLDTRKTLPGFRRLQKYAVLAGGGANHRMGLYDMVLVKDNHIKAAGGVLEALEQVKAHNVQNLRIEMEVENFDQLHALLNKGVDVIMLDNMDNATLAKAVQIVRDSGDAVALEASGNMTLERLKEIAHLDLDFISVGALTHSVKALDISMRIL